MLRRIHEVINQNNFPGPITVVDNIVYVDLEYLHHTRNYDFQGPQEFLYILGQHHDKKIVFLALDGFNVQLTAKELIRKVIEYRPARSCYLYGCDDPEIEEIIWIPENFCINWLTQCYTGLHTLPLAASNFHKKFATFYGRHHLFRLKLFRHLYEQYADDSLLAFRPYGGTDANTAYNHRWKEYFSDDLDWYQQHCPVKIPDDDQPEFTGPLDTIFTTNQRYYQQYFLEVVAETDPNSSRFLSEKTMKNLVLGKPFLLFAGNGALAYLHSLGFKTFDPLINESYDTEPNCYLRLELLLSEIDRLAAMSLNELRIMHTQLTPIFEHNRRVTEQYLSGKK